jgi:hypothetical protein
LKVTVNYGYNYTADPDQPEWFVQQWKAYYGTDELKRDGKTGDELNARAERKDEL